MDIDGDQFYVEDLSKNNTVSTATNYKKSLLIGVCNEVAMN